MLNKSCYDFLEVLSSGEPVPGGGGASALTASLGIALGSMVGALTTGKKTYAAVEEDIQSLMVRAEKLRKDLETMVNGDAEAFKPLSDAYRMPAGTPENKAAKEAAIAAALPQAAEAPLRIAEMTVEALEILEEFAQKGSVMAVSDAGTGAAFCEGALKGAALNVRINLKLIKDKELRDRLANRLESSMVKGLELAGKIYRYAEEKTAY